MRCEDKKMFYRPPLLEEPCAQTLSGNKHELLLVGGFNPSDILVSWDYYSEYVKIKFMFQTTNHYSHLMTEFAVRYSPYSDD